MNLLYVLVGYAYPNGNFSEAQRAVRLIQQDFPDFVGAAFLLNPIELPKISGQPCLEGFDMPDVSTIAEEPYTVTALQVRQPGSHIHPMRQTRRLNEADSGQESRLDRHSLYESRSVR